MSNLSDWEKVGLSKPSGTDYEEHRAQGDVSNGKRFKAVQSLPNTLRVDPVDFTTTYIGESKPGTATSTALWRIKKIFVSGTATSITFPNGSDDFSYIWDNRASLSYS